MENQDAEEAGGGSFVVSSPSLLETGSFCCPSLAVPASCSARGSASLQFDVWVRAPDSLSLRLLQAADPD